MAADPEFSTDATNLTKLILPRSEQDFCVAELGPLHSPGIWNLIRDSNSFLNYTLPRLQLQLGVIFILTQSIHTLLKRFNVSRMVSEILAGILLGPTFLGQIPGFTETLFPAKGNKYLDVLGKTGFMFFMFLVGVRMEPSMVMRTGKKVWALGFASVFVQVFVGMTVMSKVDDYISFTVSASFKYTILTQTLSPFAVVSCLLNDLKITNTEVGRIALATGLIRELLNLAVHTPLNYVRISQLGGSAMVGGKALFLYILLILAISFIMQPVYLWIIRKTPEGKPVDPVYIAFISCGVLLSAIACDFVGTRMYYFGPLILGLTIPVGPPLGSTLVERFDTISAGFLTPVLMTSCIHKGSERIISSPSLHFLVPFSIVF